MKMIMGEVQSEDRCRKERDQISDYCPEQSCPQTLLAPDITADTAMVTLEN